MILSPITPMSPRLSNSLKPYQATLVEAARFYVKNSNLIRDPRKVEDVKAELLQSKGQDSRSARYLKDLDQKLSAFVDDFADRANHEITTPELDRWIRSLDPVAERFGYHPQ